MPTIIINNSLENFTIDYIKSYICKSTVTSTKNNMGTLLKVGLKPNITKIPLKDLTSLTIAPILNLMLLEPTNTQNTAIDTLITGLTSSTVRTKLLTARGTISVNGSIIGGGDIS